MLYPRRAVCRSRQPLSARLAAARTRLRWRPNVSTHTLDFAAAAARRAAVRLALTALDGLADPAVLAAARAEFETAGGVPDLDALLG